MMDAYLIKNTTREQREQIVKNALSCGAGSCEECHACGAYGAGDPFEMYLPYIEGKKELSEITMEFKTSYLLG